MKKVNDFNLKKIISLFLCIGIIFSVIGAGFEQSVLAYSAGIDGYVERLYDLILERTSDADGKAFWINFMNRGGTAAEVAQNFFESPEFQNKSLSTEEYVTILYRSVMGREADSEGLNYWVGRIGNGVSRRAVLAMFIDSDEFRGISSSFGVTSGNIVLTDPVDANFTVAEFVTAAYRTTLGRDPDASGLSYWVTELAAGRVSGAEMVASFVSSEEITNKNLSDNGYMYLIYRSFLGRDCSSDEASYWISEKNSRSVSWRYIMNLISGSTEFITRCNNYGVNPGSVTLGEVRDNYSGIASLVNTGYRGVYGRNPTEEESSYWISYFLSGNQVKDFYNTLFSDSNFTALSADEQIHRYYTAALGREAGSEEAAYMMAVANGGGLTAVLNSIYGSTEFQNRCSAQGVVGSYVKGIYYINGRARYFDGSNFAAGGWQRMNGARYYFDEGGWMTTGWRYIDGLKYYFNENGQLVQNVDSIIGKQSRYLVKVNCYTNIVTVYAMDEYGNWAIPVVAFLVSTGKDTTQTIQGTFTLSYGGRWLELLGPVYGQYCTLIGGGCYFHSVWYYRNHDNRSMSIGAYHELGLNASHGCVRMTVGDAKWIYDHCVGSTCITYYGPEDCPFDKPTVQDIVAVDSLCGYDVTDPSI